MGINRRITEARLRLSQEEATRVGFWEDIMPRIKQGIVIPIISNSFHVEQIFREQKDSTEESIKNPKSEDDNLTIYEQLTKEWASWIDYPLPDCHNLARVAQYFLVEQKDTPQARTKFLEFLKSILLTIAQDDEDYRDVVEKLKLRIPDYRFSEIVHEMDYPRFPQGVEDPLRLLAKLPLPIYITTSYSDFLERALEAENKKPITQICFWSGVISSAKPEHQPTTEFTLSAERPLVYHLYGLEDYPQTLVLSEDDYINFLISMVEDTNTQKPIVPLSLRRALSESHLILLGYELGNWDFRVLFRFILKFRKDEFSPRGMMIQIKRDKKRIGNIEKTLEYLDHYFDRKKFDVEWNSAENFIKRLWDEWNFYRRG